MIDRAQLAVGAQPDPKSGSNRVNSGLLSALLGWTRIWTLFEANPTQLDPFFDLEGQADPTQPEFWVQSRVQP